MNTLLSRIILRDQFAVTEPNLVQYGDVTYIWTCKRTKWHVTRAASPSDQGSRYTSRQLRHLVWRLERFFRSLKNERVPVTVYLSFSDATQAITDYIVGYYSILRPREYNGGLPLNESENKYWKNANAVASFS